MPLMACVAHMHTFTRTPPPKGRSSDSAHIGESSLLSIPLLFFVDIITLLVWRPTRSTCAFDNRPPHPDVIEVEMFTFLALTEVGENGGVWTRWSSVAVNSTDKR
jgi:hypothetical protein